MAYSTVGIVNLALTYIGVKRISALTEKTPQAEEANAIWEYIRDEVLSAKDWKFAKVKVALAQNATTPVAQYDYAYTMPADFLRVCLTKKNDPSVNPLGSYGTVFTDDGVLKIYETRYSYSIEILPDGTLCLMTDYDNEDDDIILTYIKKVTDPVKYSPLFIKALSYRLAAALALARTETRSKFIDMMTLYEKALQEADAYNAMMEYVEDETGSDSWDSAGRD